MIVGDGCDVVELNLIGALDDVDRNANDLTNVASIPFAAFGPVLVGSCARAATGARSSGYD
jgi:hypothetical protein